MRISASLAVHVVLGAALFALVGHRGPGARPPAATSVELVDVTRPVDTATPTPVLVAAATPNRGGGAPVSEPKRAARRAAGRVFEDPRGTLSFDTGGGDGGQGDGTGAGTGRGTGLGFGDGATIEQRDEQLVPPPPPPPPNVSKARPARLIFPNRQREVEDGQLFVMKVTVDRDGYVSGARLVRGFGGRRDEVAQDQIWRFRYDPALDDDGSPIASTVEQRFLVQ